MSKEIGSQLASHVREVVKLRNEKARLLGYRDFFQMSLEMQEIDENWLFNTFDILCEKSKDAYKKVIDEINGSLANKYNVKTEDLGPWAFSDPFCQVQ